MGAALRKHTLGHFRIVMWRERKVFLGRDGTLLSWHDDAEQAIMFPDMAWAVMGARTAPLMNPLVASIEVRTMQAWVHVIGLSSAYVEWFAR
jgi:hypothetical protein